MGTKLYSLAICRKDGTPITYTDYKGEERSGKHAYIGAVFEGKFPGMLDVVLDKKITIDPGNFYVKLFAPKDGVKARAPQRAPAKAADDDLNF